MTAALLSADSQPRFFRPTWVEIHLGHLRRNLRLLRARLGRRVRLMLVVKGNAYGHGAIAVAREAEKNKLAQWLGVSSIEEGIALRDAGLRLQILILGSLYPFESFLVAVRYGLTPTVASLEAARRLSEATRTLPSADFKPVRCHIKLDTGMGRIGMSGSSGLEAVRFIAEHKSLELEGIYTHFSCADTDRIYTRLQLRRFRAVLADAHRAGISAPIAHAANSAAALGFKASRLDMVRPGLAAYGLYGNGTAPVLSLKSRVVFY